MSRICPRGVDGDSDSRAVTGSEQGKYVEQMGTEGMASPEEGNTSQTLL